MVNHIGSAAQASQSLSGDEFQTVEQIMEMTAKLKARDEGGTQSLAFRLNGEVALLGKEIEEANGNSLERDNRIMLLLTRIAGQQRLHNYTIGKLWDYIRALEATIKIYRPTAVAVAVRTELDQARYYFAKTILLCFPQHFSEDKVINPTDPLKVSIVWYEFKEMLEMHYLKHFDDNGAQIKSAFSSMDVDALIGVRNTRDNLRSLNIIDIPDYRAADIPIPNIHIFQKNRKDVSYLTEVGIADITDVHMYNILRFYFPVFIWAYNTVKLLLLEDDAALKVLGGLLDSQIGTDNEMTLTRTSPDYSRFDIGTGCDLRQKAFFKDRIAAMQHADTTEPNPESIPLPEKSNNVLVKGGSSGKVGEKRALDEAFDLMFTQVSNTVAGTDMLSEDEDDDKRSRKRRHIEGGRASPSGSNDGTHTRLKRDESSSTRKILVPNLAKSIAIDTIKSDIVKATERRDARIVLFNTLMRSLSILLDVNLVKLTLLKSSTVRVVTSQLAHTILMANNPKMHVDTIGRVAEVVDNYQPAGKMLKVDYNQITNSVEEEKRMQLHKVLHLSDNYFTEQKLDVEKAVDDYLQQEYQKINRHVDLQAVPDDYFVLMSYLSDLHPLEHEN